MHWLVHAGDRINWYGPDDWVPKHKTPKFQSWWDAYDAAARVSGEILRVGKFTSQCEMIVVKPKCRICKCAYAERLLDGVVRCLQCHTERLP